MITSSKSQKCKQWYNKIVLYRPDSNLQRGFARMTVLELSDYKWELLEYVDSFFVNDYELLIRGNKDNGYIKNKHYKKLVLVEDISNNNRDVSHHIKLLKISIIRS